MILVLFGTNPYSFDRLAKAIEDYAQLAAEEIIAQLGNTVYKPRGVECYGFVSRDKIFAFIEQAEIVITQGGFGSILDCLEHRKKVVAVPRKKDLGECKDVGLGQMEIVRKLEKEGRLIAVYDTKNLPMAIEKARLLRPDFEPNTKIPQLVLDFVKSVTGQE